MSRALSFVIIALASAVVASSSATVVACDGSHPDHW